MFCSRHGTFVLSIGATALWAGISASGQPPQRPRHQLTEPIYRVANARIEEPAAPAGHPLDPALKIAREGLVRSREQIRDYSCTLVKRERIKGVLNEPQYIYTEIRNHKERNGRTIVPFSVYMYFLKPAKIKGREVIYVQGRNKGKLVAHEGGNFLRMMPPIWLRPDGHLAMRGQRYPITDVGIETLIIKLIEKGERDRKRGECDVQFLKNAKINGRSCTVLQVTHPVPRPYFDFHVARIFIDDELNLPIRYAAYSWPTQAGGKPELLEEYTFLNLKINIGLTDDDFDHTKKFRS